MKNQIEVLRYVVPKRDDLEAARKSALDAMANELQAAANSGYVLASASVIEGLDYMTYVNIVTYTPPAE